MSYQVLARKWRPRKFAELVGQEHVVRALGNGLAGGRVHHAFLFTGTRGVGKTTIARILAKSLNCMTGVSAEPCGVCEHCVAIDEGRFIDLLEVDAASRTKVDDTREILDNVQYAPARGRYKVYLIDEVHMLSGHSFNALLKTLEEPPDHVKFVLATTDPQKIPVTILSRCLQFNLKRMSSAQVRGQFEHILAEEHIEAEAEALDLLARAADGSMRDGLSLLDQAIAIGAGTVRGDDVRAMLGTVEMRHVLDLLEALAAGDAAAGLAVVEAVFGLARDLSRLLADLAEALHRLALLQQVPEMRDDERPGWTELAALADRFDPEAVQLYYQIVISGRRDLALAPDARTGCEMTVLRLFAFSPAESESVPASAPRQAPAPATAEPATAEPTTAEPITAEPITAKHAQPVSPEPARAVREAPDEYPPPAPPPRADNDWAGVLKQLNVSGAVRAVASHLALTGVSDGRWQFVVSPDHEPVLTPRFRSALETALSEYAGTAAQLQIRTGRPESATPAVLEQAAQDKRQADAEAAIDADPLVVNLKSTFGASVVPGSVRPLDV